MVAAPGAGPELRCGRGTRRLYARLLEPRKPDGRLLWHCFSGSLYAALVVLLCLACAPLGGAQAHRPAPLGGLINASSWCVLSAAEGFCTYTSRCVVMTLATYCGIVWLAAARGATFALLGRRLTSSAYGCAYRRCSAVRRLPRFASAILLSSAAMLPLRVNAACCTTPLAGPSGSCLVDTSCAGSTGATTVTVGSGVLFISVVCVGAGGNGYETFGTGTYAFGGGGGALSYRNGIAVSSGDTLNIVAGTSATGGTSCIGGSPDSRTCTSNNNNANGGNSYVALGSTNLVYAAGGSMGSGVNGGGGGCATTIGSSVGYCGGAGGSFLGSLPGGTSTGGGGAGGGAAGYSGAGGAGGNTSLNVSRVTAGGAGSGGGGGGGGGGTGLGGKLFYGPPGGGVNVLGLGSSGAGGVAMTCTASCTAYDAYINTGAYYSTSVGSAGSSGSGVTYGGGGGGFNYVTGYVSGTTTSLYGFNGGGGACRVVWGTGCSYPSSAGSNCYVRARCN